MAAVLKLAATPHVRQVIYALDVSLADVRAVEQALGADLSEWTAVVREKAAARRAAGRREARVSKRRA
jgi:hypothetical protein